MADGSNIMCGRYYALRIASGSLEKHVERVSPVYLNWIRYSAALRCAHP